VRKMSLFLASCVVMLALVWASPVLAQEYPPDVEGDEEEVAPTGEGVGDEGLPTTGANLTLFAATGIIAVGTGVFIVSRARSRRDLEPEQA
jgi:LPXTG-motif cell wall-anchored protein